VRLWRALVLVVLTAVGAMACLIYAIVTHQGNLIWAASLYLGLLGLPQLVAVAITVRRERRRSLLFQGGSTTPTESA
jgi:hypothetical protein